MVERRVGRPATAATRRRSRRSRTSPSTRTAPAPCRRASRAGSTRRPSTATEDWQVAVEHDLDLVDDLQRPEQRGVGLDPPGGLRDDGAAAERPRRRRRRGRTRSAASSPTSVRSPCTRRAAAVGAVARRSSGTLMSWRLSTSSSIVCWMFALSSSPSACIPPVPSRTRSDVASAVSSTLVRPGPRRPRASPPRR